MTRMVDEERTQIGVLKALGFGNGAITAKYLLYAGSATLIGWLAGYFLRHLGPAADILVCIQCALSFCAAVLSVQSLSGFDYPGGVAGWDSWQHMAFLSEGAEQPAGQVAAAAHHEERKADFSGAHNAAMEAAVFFAKDHTAEYVSL